MNPDRNDENPREIFAENAAEFDAIKPLVASAFSKGKRSLSDAEWILLQTIARKNQSENLGFQAFVAGMVVGLLSLRLPNGFESHHSLDKMANTISQTLCADPVSKQRLLEFQQQLLQNS